ncbi:MAG: aminotransferase class IV [Odoribacter sp.]
MMEIPLFIETIQVVDGKMIHLPAHIARMEETLKEAAGYHVSFHPEEIQLPDDRKEGIVKCRILYDEKIQSIEFEKYTPRTIHRLKLVDGQHIDYHLKYADRSPLNDLRALREDCDEILIMRDGYLTDTSYSNVVLYDGINYITPATFLLNGTKRQYLIKQGVIQVAPVSIRDLKSFKRLYLINAMLEPGNNISVEITDIQE